MSDIVERLRAFHREIVASNGAESEQMVMTQEAADEIERLREEADTLRRQVKSLLHTLYGDQYEREGTDRRSQGQV